MRGGVFLSPGLVRARDVVRVSGGIRRPSVREVTSFGPGMVVHPGTEDVLGRSV